MQPIKLPKPFGYLLEKYKYMFDQTMSQSHIMEAYVDNGYQLINGLQSLRELILLSDNETCCDLYCVVAYGGRKVHILWEDKGAQGKGTHPSDGVKQLNAIYPKIKGIGRQIDFVILSNIKSVKGFLQVVHSKEFGCKVLKGPKDQVIKCCGKEIRILED